MPSGWHHTVTNLEDTLSINHNWLNGFNLHRGWALLRREHAEAAAAIEDCRCACADHLIILHAFPAKRQGASCRQAAVKGCHNPTPCWTCQIQARPNQPWARGSVFIPPPASRGHLYPQNIPVCVSGPLYRGRPLERAPSRSRNV